MASKKTKMYRFLGRYVGSGIIAFGVLILLNFVVSRFLADELLAVWPLLRGLILISILIYLCLCYMHITLKGFWVTDIGQVLVEYKTIRGQYIGLLVYSGILGCLILMWLCVVNKIINT